MTVSSGPQHAVVIVPRRADSFATRGARAALGLVGRAGYEIDRATGGTGRVPEVVDVAVGAASTAVDVGTRVVRGADVLLAPVGRVLTRPPLVPGRLTAGWWWDRLADRGAAARDSGAVSAEGVAGAMVPALVEGVVARLDLTRVVVDAVDLGAVIDTALDEVDLTAIVLDRVDLQAVVTAALDRLDLTRLVLDRVDLAAVVTVALDDLDLTEVVLTRVDLRAVVQAALDLLDLTDVVLTRVDLVEIVAAVLGQLDLTEIVLADVDLDRVVAAVLDGLDLTATVEERVDIDRLVATVDLDAVVDRIDMIAIANYIIDEIDLPEIIRESTSGVATGAVRGVRMQSIDADERVSGIVDRVLLRRRARRTDAPGDPESLAVEAELEGGPADDARAGDGGAERTP